MQSSTHQVAYSVLCAVRAASVRRALLGLAVVPLLGSPSWAAQPSEDVGLEEVIVTAQFRAENLQETPISITAISGEQLTEQGLTNVDDLGLVIPNANIRQQSNIFGPNPQIGLRGVNTNEFIYTNEPGVAVYIDDVYHGTLSGSAMDLLDLERVEVLRGPQGTLFGKNALGGAIRLFSKAPKGDDTGSIDVSYGTSNRLDIKASYDTALTDNLFMRVSGVSKRIDGYQDILDFPCQMRVNGTPALSGTLPTLVPSSAQQNYGNCKIGENGGSTTQAVRAMLRLMANESLEMNLTADYSNSSMQPGVDSVISGRDPTGDLAFNNVVIFPKFGIRYNDARFVTGDPYKTYANFNDPIDGRRWPTEQHNKVWGVTGKIDYDFTESVHLKTVLAYRTYDLDWASDGDYTPFDLSTTLNLQTHAQKSIEVQLGGKLLSDAIDWTVGAFYYDSSSRLGGYVTFGALDAAFRGLIPGFGIPNFTQNDRFTTKSKSAFAHAIWEITDAFSVTAGVRETSEDKTFAFDHTNYLTVAVPLEYGKKHFDWKVAANFKFAPSSMVYGSISTGFRSDGAQPRPFIPDQLIDVAGEEITAYEIGMKSDFLDRRLRTNLAVFLNDYDPRVVTRFGAQCEFPGKRPVTFVPFFSPCPASSDFGGTPNPLGVIPWINYFSAPGKAKGAELEITARPAGDLLLNATAGYYQYKSGISGTAFNRSLGGYVDPSVREQPRLSWNFGATYPMQLAGGGTLTPRVDIFRQGHRTNGSLGYAQLKSFNTIPGYTLVNARLGYTSSDEKWNAALSAENLFDKFYWATLGPERINDPTSPVFNSGVFNRSGVPSRGREVTFTIQRKF
jgi:iron complex outermembrane recepter protein